MSESKRAGEVELRTRRRGWAALVAVAALGLAEAAQGSPECPNGGNLLSNCGFESDATGWEFSSGDTFTRSGLETHTGLFSLEVDAVSNKVGSFALIETCVQNVSPNTPYEYGAWVKVVANELTAVGCSISILATGTSGTACGGSFQDETNLTFDPLDGTFQTLRQEFRTTASTEDISVGFGCRTEDGAIDFVAYFDDLFLIFDATVFADGFELRTGDTCEWSFQSGGC